MVEVAGLIGKGYTGDYDERWAVQEYFVGLGNELRADGGVVRPSNDGVVR